MAGLWALGSRSAAFPASVTPSSALQARPRHPQLGLEGLHQSRLWSAMEV